MGLAVDYYFTPQSPWTYLGHERFTALARDAGATVRVLPVDLGKVFPASGGLPLAQRPQQRQAYRLVELDRHARHLQMPMNLQPRYFPVSSDAASRLIVAVDLQDGGGAAMALTAQLLRAVWVDQADIADASELAARLDAVGLPADRLEASRGEEAGARYEHNTRQAIATGIFGAPSFVIDGELFWGQDRLDFVARRLAAGSSVEPK